MPSGLLATWSDVNKFVFAGNSTFTLVSKVTGRRFTYRLTTKKSEPGVLFAKLLSGPDNTSNYRYMGCVGRTHLTLLYTIKSQVSGAAASFKALAWFLQQHKYNLDYHTKLEVWHEGRCGRCGRKLTVPGSIADGIGPECARRTV
jgi:hypothetical protein